MTKEEIANIKRIDTSLNVFRKKIDSLKAKIDRLVEPLSKEIEEQYRELDFWQKPVIERYGKTTTELLKEVGEQTAEETSAEEANETISEQKASISIEEPEKAEEPVPAQEHTTEPPYEEWPKEWE